MNWSTNPGPAGGVVRNEKGEVVVAVGPCPGGEQLAHWVASLPSAYRLLQRAGVALPPEVGPLKQDIERLLQRFGFVTSSGQGR